MSHRSHRIPDDLRPNALTEARTRAGKVVYDLTTSNPTSCGVVYPDDLLAGLGHPEALRYHPVPRGPVTARRAIAAIYGFRDVEVDPDRIVLTASTSEAYSFLFRLLCDPGETVLVPTPSYPLFEQLARLDGVETSAYALDPDSGWRMDFSNLEQAPESARAVVVVHPNNPTGSFVHPEDADRLVALCRERGWALLADEVFLPYPLDGGPGSDRSFASVDDCLCCSLGGFSKSLGLPQVKLAWIVISGPESSVSFALEGLDYVADTYLSVSTPAALATSGLLAQGAGIRAEIMDRCSHNHETLRRLAAGHPAVEVLKTGGGWSAVVRIPAIEDEETLCVRLLVDHGVAVNPGFFFDFPRDGYLVVSLLPREKEFATGIGLLLEAVESSLTQDR